MGSTVVAGLFHGRNVTLAHGGDSRAYVLGPDGIRQVTRDHSWVAEQVDNGILTASEGRVHLFRNVNTQALGNGGEGCVLCQHLRAELRGQRRRADERFRHGVFQEFQGRCRGS